MGKKTLGFLTFGESLLAVNHLSHLHSILYSHQKPGSSYFHGCKIDLQTLLDQGDLKNFGDAKERGVLILIFEELFSSLVLNWFLLWGLFQYIASCLKERFFI